MSDDVLQPGEAAALLGISTSTLWRWGNLKRISYSTPSAWSSERRYTRAEVDRVLALSQQPESTEVTE